MKSFIQKIFEGEVDESVHLQFQKFSKGEFVGRGMFRVKNTGGKFSVSTGPEYAKDLIMGLAEKLGSGKTMVSGALISALDLDGFEYKEKKNAIGVRKYIIESEMTGEEILELCSKMDKAFFALSFKAGDSELTVKPKSPKSAKGVSSQKKEGEKAKIDFCKLKTREKRSIEGLVFDVAGFKNVEGAHDFIIDEIVINDAMRSEAGGDFGRLREMAHRKGRVVRRLNVDGEEKVSEKMIEV